MAVQLNIPYETLVALVEQLPDEQRRDLIHRLMEKAPSSTRGGQLRAAILDNPIAEPPSIRREDWYDDEGR
ncbi:MAG: hypothetical protein AAFV33_07765 [Chloroflexota bacterium]